MVLTTKYKDICDNGTELYSIGEILGYKIYVSRFFYSPLRYFKEDCYIWVNTHDNYYDKYEIVVLDTWLNDIADTIRETLTPKNGLSVRKVLPTDFERLSKLTTTDISDINLQESALVEDWNRNIKGFVLFRKADINKAIGKQSENYPMPLDLPSYSVVSYLIKTEDVASLLQKFMIGHFDNHLMCGDAALLWYKVKKEEIGLKDSIKKKLGFSLEDGEVIIIQRT